MVNHDGQSVKLNFGKAPIFRGNSGTRERINNTEFLRIQRNVTLDEPGGKQRGGESERGYERAGDQKVQVDARMVMD